MPGAAERTDGSTATVTVGGEVLPRRLGVVGLVMLIIAFNAPVAAMAGFQQLTIGLGNGIGAPVAFLIAGLVLMLFAVGFVGMSKHSPNPGAYYRYVVDGLGKPLGLAVAFLATVAYVVFTPGTLIYLGLILTDMTTRFTGSAVLNWQAWSVIVIAVVAVLGLLRIDLSMRVLGILVVIEVVLVALWEIAIFINSGPEGYATATFAPSNIFSGSIGLAVLFAMLTMIGIESCACFRDEARDPDRSVGRATFVGIGILMVLYALGSWAYIISQGASQVVDEALTDPVGSFFNSVQGYLGSFVVNVTVVVLITSQLAATNTGLGMASRYLHALGRDRSLPAAFAKVHPRLQSPHVAVLFVLGFSLVVVLGSIISGVDPVAAYAAMTGLGIYFLLPLLFLTSVAVIVFFRRRPDVAPSAWVSTIAPGLSALSLLVLFVLVTMNLTILTATTAGSVIAIVGVVVVPVTGYLLALRFRSTSPEKYERIGNPI